jgi:hypothetical protein
MLTGPGGTWDWGAVEVSYDGKLPRWTGGKGRGVGGLGFYLKEGWLDEWSAGY